MLVDPESVRLASHFLQDVQETVPRPLGPAELEELRKSLAEDIQVAVEEWFASLQQLMEAKDETED